MCDKDSIDDIVTYAERSGAFTRRQFGAFALAGTMAGGLGGMLARAADALAVTESDVAISTPDGVADAYFVHPSAGAHAGVLMWPDIRGLRPAFRQMGRRLAESGYAVLVPNPFYRSHRAPVVAPGETMRDEATRQRLLALMNSLTPAKQFTDAGALVAFLDAQSGVDRERRMGTAGYCMGGPMTMRTAALFPDRIGAGASFHGAALVTAGSDSPHLLVPKMKARYLIAIAANDDGRDPAAKDTLRAAFASAKLPAEIEVYPGTMHGWCPPDSEVYDAVQAEQAWARMLALFRLALN